MVVKRQCSFCAAEIEPGTGAMFVKRDGTVFHFCSGSCRKQQLHLGRVGHRFKWTRAHALKLAADRSSTQARPSAAPPHRTRGRSRPAAAAAPTPSPPGAAAPTAEAVAPEPAAPREAEKKPAKPRPRSRKKADAPPPAP
jgi:large subunit ribosomal protein L24e